MTRTVAERLDLAQAWAFEAALPYWLERGVDRRNGGAVEALTFDGQDASIPFKRIRVTCRQIYVFSHAAMLGWTDGLETALAFGRWLKDRAWRPDGAGFVRRLTATGDDLDPTIDLYDNAFALFAFAWLYKASGESWAAAAAAQTHDAIRATLAHPMGGYWHDEAKAGHRLQNPHMHLIEASLVAFEATGDGRYLEEAKAIAALFRTRFFDGVTLAENFTDAWARAPGDAGRLVEPGHMMEWAWILGQYRRLAGEDMSGPMAALIDFAELWGVDRATGLTWNAVRDDGAPLDRGSRTWPNTERLKAAVAATEILGRNAAPAADAALAALQDRYLTGAPNGGWQDHFDANGRAVAPNMPTSTLYHVFLAFAEALRVRHLLAA